MAQKSAKKSTSRPKPTKKPRAQMMPHSKTLSNGQPRPKSRK